MILGCGGVPVLSHPGRYAFISQPELRQKMEATHTMAPTLTPEEVITHLIACSGGLAGIEAFNSWHTEQQNAFWKDLADKYSIFYTVGTDFHGDDDCVLGVPAVSEHPVHRLYETCERVRNKKI
jgi:predicted metal-dependent phosphoesterase TrpH